MNMRILNLAVFSAALATVSACSCTEPTGTGRTYGDVGITYEVNKETGEVNTSRDAIYDFGAVFSDQTLDLKMVIRNLGRGQLNLQSLEKVEGAATTIGGAGDPSPIFLVDFQGGGTLGTSEAVEIPIRFAPPKLDVAQDFEVKLVLRVGGVREGEETANITLKGRGIPGACDLPESLDFGNVAVDDTNQLGFVIKNDTELTVNANIGDVYSGSGDEAAFTFAPESARGTVTIDANGGERRVLIGFKPTEQKSYVAFMKARASEQCTNEETIRLTGTGVAQVLSWSPALLDFGYVTPGIQVTRELVFTNAGSRDVNLVGVKPASGAEFGVVPPEGGDATRLLVPAATRDAEGNWTPGTATMTVFAKPQLLGPRQTNLMFNTGLAKQPDGRVTLKVFGGGPDIEVVPSPNLGFGKVAYFSNANTFQSKKLTVMNVGTAPAFPDPKANLRLGKDDGTGKYVLPYVEINALNPETDPTEFTVTVPSSYDPNVGLEAKALKNTAELMVKFSPKSVGLKKAEIVIHSNDPDEPAVKIVATADAVVLPPCNYTVSPTTLNFGLISPPNYRDLAFTIKNNGTNASDVCLLSGLDLTLNSTPTPYFSLPNGPIDQRELQPGETIQVLVRVWPQGTTPTGVTDITGRVDFYMSSDLKPQGQVLLNAQLAPSCLTIAPSSLDFGTVKVSCSSAWREFTIYNTCSPSQVSITGFAMQSGGTEFVKVNPAATPAAPLNVDTTPITLRIRYTPVDFGSDNGALAISAIQNGANVTYVVSLQGAGDSQGLQTDVFSQDAKPKADILLVIDKSGSMSDEQAELAANFASFIKYANSAAVDYHMAVIHSEFPEADFGKFLSDPVTHPEKVLTPTTPNVEAKFKAKVNVGASGYDERGAAAALKALTAPLINNENAGFLRNDAALAVVSITDETDHSTQTPSDYLNAFWNIKGFNRKTMFTFNAIAGFQSGCGSTQDDGLMATLVSQTNGVRDNICTPDWSKTLEALGKIAFGFRTNFFLTSNPDTTMGPIQVTIDGAPVPQTDSRGASIWTYDSVGNSVNFEPMYVPEPGQTLSITYYSWCHTD